MGILGWVIFGLIAGAIAKFLMPGRDGGGCFITILLGIAGSVVGGLIGTALHWAICLSIDCRWRLRLAVRRNNLAIFQLFQGADIRQPLFVCKNLAFCRHGHVRK